MPRTTSKRSRKQRDRNSLRHKKTAVDDALQEALLAPELLPDSAYRAGEQEGGEALVLLPRKKGGNGKKVEDAEAVPMSKAERRKLQQVAMKQKRRDVTIQALAKLEQHQLPDEQLELLRPTHARGAAETKRQRLKRALRLQRAGLQAEAGDELVRQRRAQRGGGSEGGLCSEASDEGDGDSEGGGAPRRSSAQAASRPAPQPYRSGAAVSEEARQQQQQQLTQQMRSAKAAAEAAKKELSLPASSKGDADGAAVGPAPPPRQEAIMPHRIRHVHRPEEVEAARLQLPIAGMEQEIVEAVGQHDVLVLSGATGCGKTTQVPQFLYEAGFGCREFPEKAGMVGVTQPRRVAAVSTAQRVAHELDSAIGDAVGYQVRYDRAVGEGTALKFMTDGILMRELQQDFLLSQYSVLVVDEAHERSLNTDLLLGMLSRLVPLRRKKAEASSHLPLDSPQRTWPLKLIIMSATLRTDDFLGNERLFPNQPPLIEVPARQYPVTVHFARHTELRNYEAACFRKVSRIHKELPPGGILVFLTGQREVESLCARLRRAFCRSAADRTEEAPAAARAGEEDDEAGVDGVGMYGADSAEALGAELESSAEEEEGTPDLMTVR